SQSVRAMLHSELQSIAESLVPLTEELSARNNWEAVCRTAYDHAQNHNIRGRVVVLGSDGGFFLARDGFFVPARPQPEPSAGEWRRFHEAQRLEAEDASRSAAVSSYLEIAAATKDRRLRLSALNAAGRTSLKLALYSQAGAAYRSVLDDWLPPIDSE